MLLPLQPDRKPTQQQAREGVAAGGGAEDARRKTMKAISGLRGRGGKAWFWLGASVLLVCWHPLSAAENMPAPVLAEDTVLRLAEQGERYRATGDAAGLAAVEEKLAGVEADRPAALLALGGCPGSS